MTTGTMPSLAEIRAFALRYGLDALTPEHIARMAELAVYVGDLGRALPRPPRKQDAPAPTFPVPKVRRVAD